MANFSLNLREEPPISPNMATARPVIPYKYAVEHPRKMGKWRLFGYDTLSEEYYPLEGKYDTKEEAMLAAESHLAKVEQTQPSESSGGQEKYGVQDRVYIERPDGSRYQYLPGDVFE